VSPRLRAGDGARGSAGQRRFPKYRRFLRALLIRAQTTLRLLQQSTSIRALGKRFSSEASTPAVWGLRGQRPPARSESLGARAPTPPLTPSLGWGHWGFCFVQGGTRLQVTALARPCWLRGAGLAGGPRLCQAPGVGSRWDAGCGSEPEQPPWS